MEMERQKGATGKPTTIASEYIKQHNALSLEEGAGTEDNTM
jgi:hypothetical protein